MGRKSKAKKLNKNDQNEVKKVSQGFFKKLFTKKNKPAVKEKSSPEKVEKVKVGKKVKQKVLKVSSSLPEMKVTRKGFLAFLLVIIIIGILATIGYFIFQSAFRAKAVAKFLPAQNTVALLEVNTNFDHSQAIKAYKLLEKNPNYSKAALIKKAEEFLGLNYQKDIHPWLGRVAGAAIINAREDENINIVYFAEHKNEGLVESTLKRLKAKENSYDKSKTYLLNEKFYLTILDDYVFLSNSEQSIYELIDAQNSDIAKLNNLDSYRKTENNLPLNKTAFFYMNFDQVKSGFFEYFSFLSKSGYSLENLSPFLRLFDSEGIALVAMENNFSLQSFLSLDRIVTENIEYPEVQGKYRAMLTDYVPSDVEIFWGTQNLDAELGRSLEILAAGDDNTIKIFDNVLESYASKYFGSDVGFKKDILPLFEDEFAITVRQKDKKNIYQLLVKLTSPQKDGVKIYEIANNFTTIGALFEPKVVEHKLPDGSVGKEIIAVPEEIIKAQHPYKGFTIDELKMNKQGWGIYYSVFDDLAVVSNDLSSIQEAIDLSKKKTGSLKQSDVFTNRMDPIIKTSDEIIYMNLDNILLNLGGDKFPELFQLFRSISSGRNYFNDGIVTISYLYLQ